MNPLVFHAIALFLAGDVQAQAQTPPPRTSPPSSAASDLTRDLNAAPPAASRAQPSPPAARAAVLPSSAAAVERPSSAPLAAVSAEAAPAPVLAAPPPPPPPSTPAVTVLDAAARAALPFSVELPPGFEIVTGRPGPDFRIYVIRRGGQSFAMVYAGPSSQFPIYSGQMVEVGGRASVISTEGGVRHAQEHLFQRASAPREIHVWTMSLEGADRAMAEQIAQSLDVR